MSHEKTITVGIDGGHYNVRTVVNGQSLTTRQAVDHAVKTQTLGTRFGSIKEAVSAAKARSKRFGKRKKKVKHPPSAPEKPD